MTYIGSQMELQHLSRVILQQREMFLSEWGRGSTCHCLSSFKEHSPINNLTCCTLWLTRQSSLFSALSPSSEPVQQKKHPLHLRHKQFLTLTMTIMTHAYAHVYYTITFHLSGCLMPKQTPIHFQFGT